MSSTSIIHFIVIIIIIIHCHHQHLLNCFGSVLPVHHEARSSQKHRIFCFQTPADDFDDEQSFIDQRLQSDISLCESFCLVVKLHRVGLNVSSEDQRIFNKSKTSDDYLAHLYNSK